MTARIPVQAIAWTLVGLVLCACAVAGWLWLVQPGADGGAARQGAQAVFGATVANDLLAVASANELAAKVLVAAIALMGLNAINAASRAVNRAKGIMTPDLLTTVSESTSGCVFIIVGALLGTWGVMIQAEPAATRGWTSAQLTAWPGGNRILGNLAELPSVVVGVGIILAWVGAAQLFRLRRGFTAPPRARVTRPQRLQAPRNPIGAFVAGVFGIAVGFIATALLVLAATATVNLQLARIGWMEISAVTGVRYMRGSIEEFADIATVPQLLAMETLFGAILAAIAAGFLNSARKSLRPANQTVFGEYEIELDAPGPRVGSTLTGRLRPRFVVSPAERFAVTLGCVRPGDDSANVARHVAYNELREIEAVVDSNGATVPFSFDVPATAPPSGEYDWSMRVRLAEKEAAIDDFKLHLDRPAGAESPLVIVAREMGRRLRAAAKALQGSGIEPGDRRSQ